MLKLNKEAATALCENFHDNPAWISGWGHAFTCPNCAATLTFDPNLQYAVPNTFSCPQCGLRSQNTALDQAWVYFYRINVALGTEFLAEKALAGDEKSLARLSHIFDFYAEHYADFAPHGQGIGKVMPQLLDESVWCIYLLQGYYPCRHLFTDAQKIFWYEKLFLPMAQFINASDHNNMIHNHAMWFKCAVGAIGVCFSDDALLDTALHGKYGIREQCRQGFTEDFFEFEGSITYQYYSLEALTGFCQFFLDKYPQDSLKDFLQNAYAACKELSWDGISLPSSNDGWYPVNIHSYQDQLQRTTKFLSSQELTMQANGIPVLPDKKTVVWTHTGFAMLHTPFLMILKSGVLTKSHMHRDALSVILPPFSDDLGTPAYTHPLYFSWYTTAASHNTIAIDGAQPQKVLPNHVEAYGNGIRAIVDGEWDGVLSAMRTLTPDGASIVDETEIFCDGEHTIDWFFHGIGFAQYRGSVQAGQAVDTGYEHMTDARILQCGNLLTAEYVVSGHTLRLELQTDGMTVIEAHSPSNPANILRHTLILRCRGNHALFHARFFA